MKFLHRRWWGCRHHFRRKIRMSDHFARSLSGTRMPLGPIGRSCSPCSLQRRLRSRSLQPAGSGAGICSWEPPRLVPGNRVSRCRMGVIAPTAIDLFRSATKRPRDGACAYDQIATQSWKRSRSSALTPWSWFQALFGRASIEERRECPGSDSGAHASRSDESR